MTILTQLYALAWVLIPAAFTIWWPLRRLAKTGRDGYRAMAVIHGVVSGLAVLFWLPIVFLNFYPTSLSFLMVLLCATVTIVDMVRVICFGRSGKQNRL